MFVRKPDSTLCRILADESVLIINLNTGASTRMSASVCAFLNCLDEEPKSIDSICAKLSDIYQDICYAELKNDAIDIYKSLSAEGYLIINKERSSIDEYSLTTLQIELTKGCNERCRHCYIPDYNKNTHAKIAPHLFYDIVAQFVEMGGKEITLTGGEPLLHEDFVEFVRYCTTKNLKINVFSNLLLLNDFIIELFKTVDIGVIQTSLYSLNPVFHDYITKVPGSCKKTLMAIDKLIDNGVEVQISCPIMRYCQEDIEKLFEYAYSKEINIRINPLVSAKTDYDNSFAKEQTLSLAECKNIYQRFIEIDREFALSHAFEICDIEPQLIIDSKSFLNKHLCSAGVDHCCISSDGNVYPCPDWEMYNLGSINTSSLCDIWYRSTTIKKLRNQNRQQNMQKCLQCDAISFCKRCLMKNELQNKGHIECDYEVCANTHLIKSLVLASRNPTQYMSYKSTLKG